MKYFNDQERLFALLSQLWEGLGVTLSLFTLTLMFSLPLGIVFALMRRSRLPLVSLPTRLYILIMRGTPLVLQIFTIYFFLPLLFSASFDRMTAAVIAFVLNYAAYFAEIYRGGMDAIPRGQREAAHVLGMTRSQTFLRIILPQVLKHIVLPISNEVITLVKDTALVTAIGIVELYRVARNATSASGSLEPLFAAGLFYLIFNALVEGSFHHLQKRLDYYKG